MQTKVCFKCLTEKALTDFYVHKQMGDGHLNKCKTCTKKDSKGRWQEKINDPVWLEKEQERHRKKYHLLGYREKHKPTPEMKKGAMGKYNSRYPEKKRCRIAASALRKQLGTPDSCELHHWNYGEGFEKDVIMLTKEQHYFLHRHLVYDQSEMMYRTKRGELLNTREKHFAYFQGLINALEKAA